MGVIHRPYGALQLKTRFLKWTEANEEVLRRQMNNEQQQSRGDEIKALMTKH